MGKTKSTPSLTKLRLEFDKNFKSIRSGPECGNKLKGKFVQFWGNYVVNTIHVVVTCPVKTDYQITDDNLYFSSLLTCD